MNSAIVGNGANSYGSLVPNVSVNCAANGAVNDAVNEAVNDAVNGAVNFAANGSVNCAANGAVNDAVNGAVNDAVNDDVNCTANGSVNCTAYGAVNGAVNGAVCSDAPETQGETDGGRRATVTSTTTMTKMSYKNAKNTPTNNVKDDQTGEMVNFFCAKDGEDLTRRKNRLKGTYEPRSDKVKSRSNGFLGTNNFFLF